MFAQGNLDFHARISIVTQHFNNTSDWLSMFTGLLHNLQHHHLPHLRVTAFTGCNQDILANATILRHHELNAMLLIQASDQTRCAMLQHLDNTGFAPTSPIQAAHARHHGVTVQGLVHFLGAQHQIGTTIFRN